MAHSTPAAGEGEELVVWSTPYQRRARTAVRQGRRADGRTWRQQRAAGTLSKRQGERLRRKAHTRRFQHATPGGPQTAARHSMQCSRRFPLAGRVPQSRCFRAFLLPSISSGGARQAVMHRADTLGGSTCRQDAQGRTSAGGGSCALSEAVAGVLVDYMCQGTDSNTTLRPISEQSLP